MGASSRRRRSTARQTAAAQAKEKDQETIRLINEAASDNTEEGLSQLRKLAVVRGLVNNDMRSRLWPRLAGVQPHTTAAAQAAYGEAANGSHRDAGTVKCDVARSLWHLVPGDAEREEKREALARILNAVAAGSNGQVFYYQGLHDVASVLLLVAGEQRAYAMLASLATGHLRDATRPSLDAVVELLQLLQPILEAADPQLASFVLAHGLPPFFALSWFITWFSHDLHDLADCARLFDLFMASHPLMPLYVGAVAMRSQSSALLALEDMPQLHTALVNLGITRYLTADALAHQAIELFKQLPPASIMRRLRPVHCVAPYAFLRKGVWCVPEVRRPPLSQQLWNGTRVGALLRALDRLPVPGIKRHKSLALMSVTGLLGIYVCVYGTYLLARMPHGPTWPPLHF